MSYNRLRLISVKVKSKETQCSERGMATGDSEIVAPWDPLSDTIMILGDPKICQWDRVSLEGKRGAFETYVGC